VPQTPLPGKSALSPAGGLGSESVANTGPSVSGAGPAAVPESRPSPAPASPPSPSLAAIPSADLAPALPTGRGPGAAAEIQGAGARTAVAQPVLPPPPALVNPAGATRHATVLPASRAPCRAEPFLEATPAGSGAACLLPPGLDLAGAQAGTTPTEGRRAHRPLARELAAPLGARSGDPVVLARGDAPLRPSSAPAGVDRGSGLLLALAGHLKPGGPGEAAHRVLDIAFAAVLLALWARRPGAGLSRCPDGPGRSRAGYRAVALRPG